VISHQDGCHSAVTLLLKAALIQVSDNRLLGASGFTKEDQCPTPDELNFFFGQFTFNQ
jgi:hypothetical protein